MKNNVIVKKSIKKVSIYLFSLLILGLFFSSTNVFGNENNNSLYVTNLELINLRVMGDNDRVRIISTYKGEPSAELQLLGMPPRLVINLPKTTFSLLPNSVVATGLVKSIRYGVSGAQNSRIILGMNNYFQVENMKLEKLENGLWQQVYDIIAISEDAFNKNIKAQLEQRIKVDTNIGAQQKGVYRIVIDAGHGGKDSGALGIRGTLEKNITLSFANKLENELKKYSNIEVFLTRSDDTFLRLGERVSKARAWNADLFVSIHADSINDNGLRGATVYTISDKASDSIARNLAESENKADLLDGLPADEYPEIADILLDLTQKETHRFSVSFADQLVKKLLENDVKMIKNPHRFAGFQVLRAPDIPSILIEIGYLSNEEDEKLITNSQWQEKLAGVMAQTIYNFASLRKPRNP